MRNYCVSLDIIPQEERPKILWKLASICENYRSKSKSKWILFEVGRKGGERDMNMKRNNRVEFIKGFDGKVVCLLTNNRLIKTAHGPYHMLQSPPSWSFDAFAYDSNRRKFSKVVVVYWFTGQMYSISANDFDSHKKELDWGYGRQFYVPLKFWDTSDIFDDEEPDDSGEVVENGD
jgi:hypothetical protein